MQMLSKRVPDGNPGLVPLICSPSVFQGRHVKTGQLAAIKVMDVTGVSDTRLL